MVDLIVYGIIAHLTADWILQNHWMAINKSSLTHPAAWTHGGIHFVAMLFIFNPVLALAVACSHIVIDTRIPAKLWQKLYKQTTKGEYALHVAIWLDQVLHIITIVFFAWIATI